MPIAGITEGTGRLPIVGHIRKGAEAQQGVAPQDLDYLRFTSDEYPELVERWVETYGEQAKQVRVRLPYPAVDDVLEAWYEQYISGSMVRRCTGRVCVWHRDQSTGWEIERDVPCARETEGGCGCQTVGRLNVLVPALGMLGTVTVHTSSSNDIRTLYRILRGLADPEAGAGLDLRSLPFILSRVPKSIPTPGTGGKPVRRTKYLLDLQVAQDAVDTVIQALGTASAPAPALPAPQPEQRLLEVAADLGGRVVDTATGEILEDERDQEPAAGCPACGGSLEPGGGAVVCSSCGHTEGDEDVVDGEVVEAPPVPKVVGTKIPPQAWKAAGLEPIDGVDLLADADVATLTAMATATYKTKTGKAFADKAAEVLTWLQSKAASSG